MLIVGLCMAFGPSTSHAGTPSVIGTATVISGPNNGSSTQAGNGDTVRYKYAVDPRDVSNPSAVTTVALSGAQNLAPGSAQVPDGTTVTYSTDGNTPATAGTSVRTASAT
jgi:hypothetical protein